MDQLLKDFIEELHRVIAEGCQVILMPDGSTTRIAFGEMDRDSRGACLDACVDFTAYVNRGMDPETGSRIVEELLDK